MKRIILPVAALVFLLSGCDGLTENIDDIPRTLRISAKQMTDVDGGWAGEVEGFQEVSAADGDYAGTIGSVDITSPQDSYVRSDTVLVDATVGTLEFAYWLFPSRTETSRDSDSTEGNIRYALAGIPEEISLRTDYRTAEIIGVFAEDGNDGTTGFSAFSGGVNFAYLILAENEIEFSIRLFPSTDSTRTIYEPMFRIFDDTGEARTDWESLIEQNDALVIPNQTDLGQTFKFNIPGVINQGTLSDWTVVVIYKDSADAVYVVK